MTRHWTPRSPAGARSSWREGTLLHCRRPRAPAPTAASPSAALPAAPAVSALPGAAASPRAFPCRRPALQGRRGRHGSRHPWRPTGSRPPRRSPAPAALRALASSSSEDTDLSSAKTPPRAVYPFVQFGFNPC